jgi:hypothetical protein
MLGTTPLSKSSTNTVVGPTRVARGGPKGTALHGSAAASAEASNAAGLSHRRPSGSCLLVTTAVRRDAGSLIPVVARKRSGGRADDQPEPRVEGVKLAEVAVPLVPHTTLEIAAHVSDDAFND